MKFMNNKRALSPLIATALLVISALLLGIITMSWGKAYIPDLQFEEKTATPDIKATITIPIASIDTPLKQLQIDYITGRISKEEYLNKEREMG